MDATSAPAHQGLKDLLTSERGTICVLLILVSALLVMTGKLDVNAWMSFAKWITTILVASKTVTGAIETWTGSGDANPATSPTPGAGA